MCQAWHDFAVNVGLDVAPWLSVLWRGGGELWCEIARGDGGDDAAVGERGEVGYHCCT